MTEESTARDIGVREVRRVIEGLLLVANGPLFSDEIREVTGASPAVIRDAIEEIRLDCEETQKGYRLKELAGGYQFVTDPALALPVKAFLQAKDKRKLSQASLETLSIIAYRQPLTRAEIEFVRGVNVDGSLKTLLEKGLIRICGRKEVPGRPILYSTTKDFLDHFGLASLKELPKLAEFTEKDIELPESLKEREAAEAVAQPEGGAETPADTDSEGTRHAGA